MEQSRKPNEWHTQNDCFVCRHDIVRKPEYVAEIDEFKLPNGQQFLLGHIRFHKFNKTTFRQMLAEWKIVRTHITAPIFAYAMEGDEAKWEKFIRKLGFKPTDTFAPTETGERRRIFIHEIS